jgi:hypothetical protein
MMSYLGFQRAALRAFWQRRSEADYPQDAAWIADVIAPVSPRAQPQRAEKA